MSEIVSQPDNLDPNQQLARQVLQASIQLNQSNIAAPEVLAAYEKIIPGAAERQFRLAERAVDMSEKEQSHIHKMQEIELQANITDRVEERNIEKRGQILAFLFSVSALATATILGIYNQPVPSSILGGGTLVAIVVAFIKGKKVDSV